MTTRGRTFITGHNGRVRPDDDGTISNGYHRTLSRDHPFSDRSGYVITHRLVAERMILANDPDSPYLIQLGRRKYLDPAIVVHHIDGDPLNNEPTNLAPMTRGEHTALHHAQGDIRI